MASLVDITGQTFGTLTVLEKACSGRAGVSWICSCACGGTKVAKGYDLRIGKVKSCGCKQLSKAKPSGEAAFLALFREYKNKATKRGHKFNLTQQQFSVLIKKNCFYCGVTPSQIVRNKYSTGTIKFNGIDRINNSNGYEVTNCVPCCGRCNKAKGKSTSGEFSKYLESLVSYRIELMTSIGRL